MKKIDLLAIAKKQFPDADQEALTETVRIMQAGYDIAMEGIKLDKDTKRITKHVKILIVLTLYLIYAVLSVFFAFLFVFLLDAPVWAGGMAGICLTTVAVGTPIKSDSAAEKELKKCE